MGAPRVALVHDWLTNLGGGERVLWELHQLYPEAPIYTSVYNPERLPQFKGLDVRTSFLQRLPLARTKHQLFPMLRCLAFESFDFSQYDLVISTSSAESKGIITPPGTLHVAYLFTPTRYYWSDYHRYLADPGFGWLNPLVRRAMPRVISGLRQWDYAAAQRPDVLVADSKFVAARIAKFYSRPATVIYPPVELERFEADQARQEYYLVVSRLIPYKRVDLAIRAFNQLKLPLRIVGAGTEMKKLQHLAGPTISFMGKLDDAKTAQAYAHAKALIFPTEEDFGITPLEAMASGSPVIAYSRGGVLETVVEGKTGLFFNKQTVESLVDAVERSQSIKFDPLVLRRRAEEFNVDRFRREIQELVAQRSK